ncbi:periplasmic oligopeptide-binding protein of oligopeptide ABC transporter [Thermosynechococcus vestitus BP-1]|uniref:Periplasmic oligopeptide-binding protein of oligopeptide ABC transporter n=1 Tax=Thermosynechococcus vestitus (strain NIES-2133 / IAM M-273 / BP-1) TaxID=197221 RepID=Q8DIX3_THEVB|nr:periplasmic oligopeptide-binding protein of oligopeptide ABC transporter [Thermosynechococcus vestitus BP-1]
MMYRAGVSVAQRLLRGCLVLLLSLLLVACGGEGSHQGDASIVIGTTARLRTLDPADAYENLAGLLLFNLGDRLYTYKGNDLIPQLATALPEVSDDGLTYRIPLRRGVYFHDGTPFNAAAMAFSLQRFISSGGQPASLLAGRVKEIKAIADDLLEIRLREPFVAFPHLLAFSGLCAVSPTAYGAAGNRFLPTQFVGTGPYRLAAYRTDGVRLEPFADYWGTKPENAGIRVQIFSSSANLYNAFRTGAVDVAIGALDPNQIRALKTQAPTRHWQVITGAGNAVTVLSINMRQPPWDQLAARQVLAASVNRQRLVERVFLGEAEPLYSLVPSVFPVSEPVFRDRYGDGHSSQIEHWLQKTTISAQQPLVVNLWYRANVPSNVLAATVLKASLERDLGDRVQVQLDSADAATIYRNLESGAYPLVLLDWYGDFYDADNYLEPFLSCDRGSVATGCERGASAAWGSFFYSPEANDLIAASRREANPQRRGALLRQLQELNAEAVAFLPLWQSETTLFAQPPLRGLALDVNQLFAFAPLRKDQ